jgi:hypothetical protein
MEDLIAGRQSYRGLKWRLLRTLEARLMWRALVDSKRWYNSSIFSSKKKQE